MAKKIKLIEETNTLTGKKRYTILSRGDGFLSYWSYEYSTEDKENSETEYERLKEKYAPTEVKTLKEDIV